MSPSISLEFAQLARQHLVARRGLEIHPQQLLLAAGDDSQLDGGLHAAVMMQPGTNAFALEQGFEPGAGLVRAHDGQQRHLGTQRRRIARDVGRAARALLFVIDLDDRHRRFGRNALDLADPVAVEHGVADDQHARAS